MLPGSLRTGIHWFFQAAGCERQGLALLMSGERGVGGVKLAKIKVEQRSGLHENLVHPRPRQDRIRIPCVAPCTYRNIRF